MSFLIVEYVRTAAWLERLRDGRLPVASLDQAMYGDDRFVAEYEPVISAQNESWMTRVGRIRPMSSPVRPDQSIHAW
jgi:hypothetical protein